MFGRDLDGGTALNALRVHGNKQGLFGGCLDIEVVFEDGRGGGWMKLRLDS